MITPLTRVAALLEAQPAAAAGRRGDARVRRLVMDSRQVQPGDLYAAVPGAAGAGAAGAGRARSGGRTAGRPADGPTG